jgi:hypothetical protein
MPPLSAAHARPGPSNHARTGEIGAIAGAVLDDRCTQIEPQNCLGYGINEYNVKINDNLTCARRGCV